MHVFSFFLIQPKVTNDLGSHNNVVRVKSSDFEVFEALAMDSFTTSNKTSKYKMRLVLSCMQHSLFGPMLQCK